MCVCMCRGRSCKYRSNTFNNINDFNYNIIGDKTIDI